MTFVDTSAWFPIFLPNDPKSISVRNCIFTNRTDELVTTDYVVDETLTLLRARNEGERALEAGKKLLGREFVSIEFVSEIDFNEAWGLFKTHADKKWSFTDCTSYTVMKRLQISTALAFDRHIEQFGFLSLVP